MTYSKIYQNLKLSSLHYQIFFSNSCHEYPICPFLKQLIFQCVHIYEVYSYMFECLEITIPISAVNKKTLLKEQ